MVSLFDLQNKVLLLTYGGTFYSTSTVGIKCGTKSRVRFYHLSQKSGYIGCNVFLSKIVSLDKGVLGFW